jgi:hypothetical protein
MLLRRMLLRRVERRATLLRREERRAALLRREERVLFVRDALRAILY